MVTHFESNSFNKVVMQWVKHVDLYCKVGCCFEVSLCCDLTVYSMHLMVVLCVFCGVIAKIPGLPPPVSMSVTFFEFNKES